MSGPDHSGLATTPLLLILGELFFVSSVVVLLSILPDDWIVLMCAKQFGPHGGLIGIPSVTACTAHIILSATHTEL